MLVGFRQLAEMSKTHPWGHAMVISGSDYPVKSVDHMSRLLKHFGPTSHFEIFQQVFADPLFRCFRVSLE